MNKKINGFTMVEMAIVLVVIGLIVSGVLAGAELVKHAKYTATAARLRDYTAGYQSFNAKFRKMPGDYDKAVQFGLCTDTSGAANCGFTPNTISGNGNADDTLDDSANNTLRFDGEMANFWVHMTNGQFTKAGFTQVNGCQYTSAGDPANCKGIAGENFPKVPTGVGIVAVYALGVPSSVVANGEINSGLYYVWGLSDADIGFSVMGVFGGANSIAGMTMTPEEAYYFDSKLDDGDPVSGKITTINQFGNATAVVGSVTYRRYFGKDTSNAANCFTTVSGISNYNVNVPSKKCTLKMMVARSL